MMHVFTIVCFVCVSAHSSARKLFAFVKEIRGIGKTPESPNLKQDAGTQQLFIIFYILNLALSAFSP